MLAVRAARNARRCAIATARVRVRARRARVGAAERGLGLTDEHARCAAAARGPVGVAAEIRDACATRGR